MFTSLDILFLCYIVFSLIIIIALHRSVVPNLLGTRGQFCGRHVFHGLGGKGGVCNLDLAHATFRLPAAYFQQCSPVSNKPQMVPIHGLVVGDPYCRCFLYATPSLLRAGKLQAQTKIFNFKLKLVNDQV